MDEGSRVQVQEGHYDFSRYVAKPRFCSYWHQIDEVLRLNPATLLVVGKGDGIVIDILQKANPDLSVTTFDFDPALRPDIVGDIREIQAAAPGPYDCILCCQVLEHVEYRYFGPILRQLAAIAPHVVLSIPCQCRTFGIALDLPKLHVARFFHPQRLRMDFAFDGQHYWEAGTRGHSKREIEAALSDCFSIRKRFHVPEKPWHLFYILERRPG